MKKIILISILLCTILNAKWTDFENPNGDPFLLTLSLEKKGGKPSFSLPISKFATIRYTPSTGGNPYEQGIDIHLPIYKLWKK